MPKFDTVLLHSNWSSLRRKYLSKIPTDVNALSCEANTWIISEFRTPFPPRDIRKNPRNMYARVLQVMAQFVLKIDLLSHIMGTTPILEMARAYGLRPRLWLLVKLHLESLKLYMSPSIIFAFESLLFKEPWRLRWKDVKLTGSYSVPSNFFTIL